MKQKIFILDGFSLIFRSYWAFINNPVKNPEGKNVSAVFGFFSTLVSLLDKYQPDRFIVAMDSPGPTFRHDIFADYKGTREKAPEDLTDQVPVILDLLETAGITVISKAGYEADDIMAAVSRESAGKGWGCHIVSADKDLMQAVSENVHMLRPEKGDYLDMGPAEVFEKMGVRPDQIIDYLSLIGDSSDNIPGVRGIGPKTASGLLEKFGTLDGIYENLDSCSKGQAAKLAEDRENAYLSRRLIELDYNIAGDLDTDNNALDRTALSAVIPLLLEHGMNRLADRYRSFLGEEKPDEETGGPGKKGNYSAVVSIARLDKLVETVKTAGLYALDVETDNIDSMQASPVGFCISCEEGTGYYIPLVAEGKEILPAAEVKKRIEDIVSDTSLKVIGHNFKYDYKVLKRWGVNVRNLYFDTMVAAWLLDTSANGYGMDALAERHLNYTTVHFKDIVPKDSLFSDLDLETAVPYAAEDADITLRFYQFYSGLLAKRGLEKLFFELEMPLVTLLADAEYHGISLDSGVLEDFGRELEEKLARLQDEIYIECGGEFNINSTRQLQKVLFEDRKLQPVKKTKTGYSTDSTVLEILSREDIVPEMILRHRAMLKLKSTYVDALPSYINPVTGRVHTHLLQTGTATGRLSSKDPNLQNIPIKSEEGRRIRSAFRADPGYVFLSADYSQIELVVLAHLSGDEALKKAFVSGNDVHSETGSLIFQKPLDEVTKDDRRIAKTINFGVMYGMSAFRLARDLNIARSQADQFIKSYFEKYSGIRDFIDSTVKEAEKSGKVVTLLGREREITAINSRNKTEKSGAERIAVNTPIQGSAADIVKTAMLAVNKRLGESGLGSKLILQVHDELVFEVPEGEIEEMISLVKEEMESAVRLSIPLRVSIETGRNWGDLH